MRPISDEASRRKSHLTSGISKGFFTPLLQLKKFPDIPVSTREEAREFRPQPEEPRFRLLAREEGSFPAWSGKNSRLSRRISRGEALHRKGERNYRVVPHSQSPLDVSVHSRETCFPALPRLSSRGSNHTMVARRKDSWESLVGKPRGKAPDPLIHAKGSATLLLQLGRKAHVHAPTSDEDGSPGETPEVPQDLCQHWRGILRFRDRLHTRS